MRQDALLRIFDANFNRATEALRVIEDCVRFGLDQPELTRAAKNLRHQLVQVINELGLSALGLLTARDVEADVGGPSGSKVKLSCRNISELVRANFKRLQEALRVMEEFTGTCSPAGRARLEKLRYQSYILEKRLASLHTLQKQLEEARLCVILTTALASAPLEEAASAAVAGGADIIQLREKELPDRHFESLAKRVKKVTRDGGALFIVNDRAHIARTVDADGVHVGQQDLSVASARKVVGAGKLVGVSTHSLQQARQAESEGADYLGIRPVFATATKPDEPVVGVQLVAQATGQVQKPAFAIGGITSKNIAKLVRAGLKRVAVCSGVISTKHIETAARQIKAKLIAH